MPLKALIISLLFLCSYATAQTSLLHRIGIGHNPVKRTYAEISTVASYTSTCWELEAGLNWQGNTYYGSSIQAFTLGALYNLPVSQPISVGIHYMYHPHNQLLLSEQNLALMATYMPQHLDVYIGSYIRHFTSKKFSNQSVSELGYLLYQLNVYVFPKNYIYNAMIGVRSYDTFEIEQAGNPMYVLQLSYRPSTIHYFLEGCVKPAGFYNIHVNPFHTQLRGGILWTL
ncbi:MAG TPA: hypothetical protein PLJ82_06705 [Paludibacteraceae bacterium]|nr:hypothetical protein [Paludibacteraceae bacterium]